MRHKNIFIKGLIVVLVLVLAGSAYGDEETKKLAEAAQNPISDMISFPYQSNFDMGYGAGNDMAYVLDIQPIIPFGVSKNWNLITRTIVPVLYLPEVVPEAGCQAGLGDINPSLFLSPSKPSKFIWGVGPTFTFPSATDTRLGTGKWLIGPTAVIVYIDNPWLIACLYNNQWSIGGRSGRPKVNKMLLQPVANYNFPKGWYLTSVPLITANWEAKDKGDVWTVPVGGGIGKIIRIGKQPINLQVQSFYNVSRPSAGPDWSIRFQVQFLFPKS